MQGFFTKHTPFPAYTNTKMANPKNSNSFTDKIWTYLNTPSIYRFVNFALWIFSARPILNYEKIKITPKVCLPKPIVNQIKMHTLNQSLEIGL